MSRSFWRIELLGRFRAVGADRTVTRFSTRATASLLAYLAYYLDVPQPRERLAFLLWPEAEAQASRLSLRVALASLRRQLEPPGVPTGTVLAADRTNITLQFPAVTTDVREMESLLQAAAQTADPAERLRSLSGALALYRGPLLPGSYEDWVVSQQQRMSDLYCRGALDLAQLLETSGAADEAIYHLRQAADAEPLREDIHLRLMQILAGADRTEEARKQFNRLEEQLREELGAAPDAAVKAFAQSLQPGARRPAPTECPHHSQAPGATSAGELLAAPGDKGATPPTVTNSPPVMGDHLPYLVNRFIGRSTELARLRELLSELSIRLLTLHGPAGSGKTRLAIETVQSGAAAAPVVFLPLAEIGDPEQVVPALLRSLPGAPDAVRESEDLLVERLSGEARLLVLDNAEHLLEEVARLVSRLLARVPQLKCLVTSTACLGVAGEVSFPVRPLPVPPSQPAVPEDLVTCESVRLFVDRAQAVRPDFQITRGNAAAVAALCRRLEGFPLALELAAAWATVLTPAQMVAGLEERERQAGDHPVLTSRRRDGPHRHRSLYAAMEWSCSLLTPEEICRFARLSVFRGGWTPSAASQVAGEDILLTLARLRDCSLVVCDAAPDGEGGDALRFRMLDSLRNYAGSRLSAEEAEEAGGKHSAYFLQLAREQLPRLRTAAEPQALQALESEHENLRTALDRFRTKGDARASAELGLTLGCLLQRRGYAQEAEQYLRQGLEALTTTEDPADPLRGWLQREMAVVLLDRLRRDEAVDWARAALDGARLSGDVRAEGHALNLLGLAARGSGRWREARELLCGALDRLNTAGDEIGIAMAANNLGLLEEEDPEGSLQQAVRRHEEALAHFRKLGYERGAAECLTNLGGLIYISQEPGAAAPYYVEALNIELKTGHLLGVARALANLGEVRLSERRFHAAYRLLSASLALFEQMASPHRSTIAQLREQAAASLDRSECAPAAREAGREQSLEALVRWALDASTASHPETP